MMHIVHAQVAVAVAVAMEVAAVMHMPPHAYTCAQHLLTQRKEEDANLNRTKNMTHFYISQVYCVLFKFLIFLYRRVGLGH